MTSLKETTMANGNAVHKFEAAGLGVAPFRFVGTERFVFQAIPGDPSCPLLPGTCCDYCSTAISIAYWVESADRRRFKVGCDCIAKVGDAGLRKAIAPELRKAKAARDAERIDAARAKLADPQVRAELAAKPHSRGFTDRATGEALTALDELEWLMAHSGTAGRIRVARALGC
jgi:hypothetical protein